MKMTQQQLNQLPPAPDPANFIRLELDQTRPIFEDAGGNVKIAVTLRRIEGDVAVVQITSSLAQRRKSP